MTEEFDPIIDKARDIVGAHRRASISFLQRYLQIGYNRAARLLEALEKEGFIGAMDADGHRPFIGARDAGEPA